MPCYDGRDAYGWQIELRDEREKVKNLETLLAIACSYLDESGHTSLIESHDKLNQWWSLQKAYQAYNIEQDKRRFQAERLAKDKSIINLTSDEKKLLKEFGYLNT